MGGRRKPTEEERELFETALGDAVPLKGAPPRKRKAAKPEPPAAPPLAQPPQHRPSSHRTIGIDGSTADRLRRGLIEPQARLDLHGLTERDAHRALVTFLRQAKSRKLRLVLIVTGKGGDAAVRQTTPAPFDLGRDMRMRGVLRVMTPRWLQEPGFAELIADVREAHRRHGGAGALYVYLRK